MASKLPEEMIMPSARPGDACRKILFVSYHCYLDSSSGAAVSSRDMMRVLARLGYRVEVLSGSLFDAPLDGDPIDKLVRDGWPLTRHVDDPASGRASGVWEDLPPHALFHIDGIPVTVCRGNTSRAPGPEDAESRDFLRLFGRKMGQLWPDVVIGYGGDHLLARCFAEARRLGAKTIFTLHNCNYKSRHHFDHADLVRVPSAFASQYYRGSLSLECVVLPNAIDNDRIRVDARDPRYLTFVNPSSDKGLCVFARVADELGRRRPDIPLLVVESRQGEAEVAACGLDLRVHGNVFFMANAPDPRDFLRVSRAVMMPSLVEETFGRVAAEAMSVGVPVLVGDRGALPEIVGAGGLVLPIPVRLTPGTRELPTPEEVRPWMDAIIRLWDEAAYYADLSTAASVEARQWDAPTIDRKFESFIEFAMNSTLNR